MEEIRRTEGCVWDVVPVRWCRWQWIDAGVFGVDDVGQAECGSGDVERDGLGDEGAEGEEEGEGWRHGWCGLIKREKVGD